MALVRTFVFAPLGFVRGRGDGRDLALESRDQMPMQIQATKYSFRVASGVEGKSVGRDFLSVFDLVSQYGERDGSSA